MRTFTLRVVHPDIGVYVARVDVNNHWSIDPDTFPELKEFPELQLKAIRNEVMRLHMLAEFAKPLGGLPDYAKYPQAVIDEYPGTKVISVDPPWPPIDPNVVY